MRVVVLGAGVVGVTAAWYLAEDGHEVTVVDRQSGPALETSFANGGQISASHAEPWANPRAPLQVLKWLGRDDAPLLFRLTGDWRQWSWGLKFLLECLPSRTKRNTIQCLNLALYSRDCLKALRAATGIRYDHLERGILQFYTDAKEFADAVHMAELIRQYGCDRDDNVLKHAPHTAAVVCADRWKHSYRREEAAYPIASLRGAKYWPPVARVDNVYGDRNLFCSCIPVTDYAGEAPGSETAAAAA